MTLENFQGIFKNKTVFVTGHTGFQGSWLSLWLKLLGANVIGYSLEPPTKPSLFESLDLQNEMTHIIADIRDKKKLSDSLKTHKPDFVFHLAAQSLVRISYEKPLETFETNVIGTVNVLESIRNCTSVRSCIIMTSDKCYDNKTHRPHLEDDPMGGYDPYSASKGSAELAVSAYRNSFFGNNRSSNCVEIATTRVGNVIGGGDWAKDRIIPDSIRSICDQENIHIRNPNFIRPWQYVLEPLSGILWLATKMYLEPNKFSGAWNFGPSVTQEHISVKELVSVILEKWNSNVGLEIDKNSNDLYESPSLTIDSSKSKKYLGWENIFSIEEAIDATVLWYKKFINVDTDIQQFTTRQIDNYIAKAKEKNLIWAN